MENIYNLIPQEQNTAIHTFKHTSKFNTTVKDELSATKSPGKLFGPKGGVKPNTKTFMRKGHGAAIKAKTIPSPGRAVTSQTILAPPASTRMPSEKQKYVPRHTETSTFAPRTNQEFVKTNRLDATSRPARSVKPAYIDKPAGGGARFLKEESGLVPKYSQKGTYGKTPAYLKSRKAELEAERSAQYQPSRTNDTGLRKMDEAERADILQGLRANWETLHREYQGLSLFVDTIPKKTRRNNMEAQLNQLEADINRFEHHKVIYVDTR